MKNIFTSILFTLLILPAWSQTGVHVGAIFMPQATWLLNEDLEGGEFTFGTAYGANANIHFSPKWGVGADILISNEGQRFTNNSIESTMEVSYLKVPLLLHFNSDPNASTPFLGEAGIMFTSVTKAKFTVDGTEVTPVDENGDEIDPKKVFNSSNLGAVLAFGPGFWIGTNLMLTTMVRFDIQLQDAVADDFNVVFGETDRKETYPMTVGLKFGLKLILGDGAGHNN